MLNVGVGHHADYFCCCSHTLRCAARCMFCLCCAYLWDSFLSFNGRVSMHVSLIWRHVDGHFCFV